MRKARCWNTIVRYSGCPVSLCFLLFILFQFTLNSFRRRLLCFLGTGSSKDIPPFRICFAVWGTSKRLKDHCPRSKRLLHSLRNMRCMWRDARSSGRKQNIHFDLHSTKHAADVRVQVMSSHNVGCQLFRPFCNIWFHSESRTASNSKHHFVLKRNSLANFHSSTYVGLLKIMSHWTVTSCGQV